MRALQERSGAILLLLISFSFVRKRCEGGLCQQFDGTTSRSRTCIARDSGGRRMISAAIVGAFDPLSSALMGRQKESSCTNRRNPMKPEAYNGGRTRVALEDRSSILSSKRGKSSGRSPKQSLKSTFKRKKTQVHIDVHSLAGSHVSLSSHGQLHAVTCRIEFIRRFKPGRLLLSILLRQIFALTFRFGTASGVSSL